MKKLIVCISAFLLFCSVCPAQKWENIALTPQMGWNSWNKFARDINEELIREIADAIVANGLDTLGYEYVNLDDCWHGQRDSLGFIHEDPEKFPSGMKALADYVHSKGLKLGLYSDGGTMTCACMPGSLGHEYQDAYTYAQWGIDYLKYDWCHTENVNVIGENTLMSKALRDAGRPVLFSMCNGGDKEPWLWGADIAHSWRMSCDIGVFFDYTKQEYDEEGNPLWRSYGVLEIIDNNADLRKYAGPGHWNDPDMLEVGNGLSFSEDRAHFSMWCMMASPLILGNDLRSMSEETKSIITNRDVIAVDQDSLGIQGLRYRIDDQVEYWFKPLQNGDWAMCILNRGTETVSVQIDWKEFCFTDDLSGRSTGFDNTVYTVKDLWAKTSDAVPVARRSRSRKTSLPRTDKPLSVTVPGHDVAMFRLIK